MKRVTPIESVDLRTKLLADCRGQSAALNARVESGGGWQEDLEWEAGVLELQQKLCTDDQMKLVWRRLETELAWAPFDAKLLIREAYAAQEDYRSRKHPTRAQHSRMLNTVARKAAELRMLLEELPDVNDREGFTPVVDLWDWGYLMKDLERAGSVSATERRTIKFVRRWLCGEVKPAPYAPTHADVLYVIEGLAKERAACSPVLKQPNTELALAYYVGPQLVEYFLRTTGKQRYTDVAAICAVISGTVVEPENLRKVMRARPPSSGRK